MLILYGYIPKPLRLFFFLLRCIARIKASSSASTAGPSGVSRADTARRVLVVGCGLSAHILFCFHRNGQRNRRLSGIRQRKVFLQGVGGKFLAHARAVQHAARSVVYERGSVDAPFLRVAQYGVDALFLEPRNELLLVIRALQARKARCVSSCRRVSGP